MITDHKLGRSERGTASQLRNCTMEDDISLCVWMVHMDYRIFLDRSIDLYRCTNKSGSSVDPLRVRTRFFYLWNAFSSFSKETCWETDE